MIRFKDGKRYRILDLQKVEDSVGHFDRLQILFIAFRNQGKGKLYGCKGVTQTTLSTRYFLKNWIMPYHWVLQLDMRVLFVLSCLLTMISVLLYSTT